MSFLMKARGRIDHAGRRDGHPRSQDDFGEPAAAVIVPGHAALGAAELMLSVAGDDPLVAPVHAHVTRQRMNALRKIFTELGMTPAEAADQAWLAYAFYIGHHQLRKNPEIAARRPTSIDRMARLLTGGLTR